MSRIWNVLFSASAFGVFAGGVLAGFEIRGAHYLDHDHYTLALESWTRTTYRAVGIALAAALVSMALREATRRLGWNERASGLAAFLVASLPVWGWMPFHARALFPAGRTAIAVGLSLLVVAHIVVYVASIQVLSRRTLSDVGFRRVGAFAFTVLALSGVARELRFFADSRIGERPNVLVIVLDTVRADRFSSYGYERATTPELDAFAANSIRFANFYSTTSWTIPSHASLFTGLFPIRHGATQENLNLADEYATLAEVLRNAGYQTFAASQNPFVNETVNLVQGFEHFVALWRQWVEPDGSVRHADREPHLANAAFAGFLAEADRDRPFFAFLNYIDAHLPAAPPEPFLSRFLSPDVDIDEALRVGRERWSDYYLGKSASARELAILSDLYDGEIAYLSFRIGELLDALQRDGRFNETLIVVTSDHGEHLGDHGHLGHQFTLYNATVRVPLILKLPGVAHSGRVEDRPGQLLDLYPTVLNAIGVDFDAARIQGIDLLSGEGRSEIFAEYYYPAQAVAMYEG